MGVRPGADGSGPEGEETPDPRPGDDCQREFYLTVGVAVSELVPAQQVLRGTARPEVSGGNEVARRSQLLLDIHFRSEFRNLDQIQI